MKKVLIIDDDEIVREPMKIYLTHMGYRVNVAKNGKEGIDIFRKMGNFDVVVTDIEMPKINGIAVAYLIRASGKSRTHIVGITGAFDPLLQQEMFDIVLPKPFSLERLASLIESFSIKRNISI